MSFDDVCYLVKIFVLTDGLNVLVCVNICKYPVYTTVNKFFFTDSGYTIYML